MKLNQLSISKVKKSLVQEVNDLDKLAKEELDGIDDTDQVDDVDMDIDAKDDVDIDIESENVEPPPSTDEREYNVKDVRDQLNGMVEKWFNLAKQLDPEKKKSFLKLGDRLSEITDVLESEFINA